MRYRLHIPLIAMLFIAATNSCATRPAMQAELLGPPMTLVKLGGAQGLTNHDGTLWAYGDAKPGVIRALVPAGDAYDSSGKQILLTVNGKNEIVHPTGLAFDPQFGVFLGNTVNKKGSIYWLDWDRALSDGTLDHAIKNRVEDDAAVQGARPVYVKYENRKLLATSDYGPQGNQVRLYDPEKLATAKKTSDDGVMVARFSCGPWVQNLQWYEDRNALLLIQNITEGRGWRLALVDLPASIKSGTAVEMARVDLPPGDEMEGFTMIDATTGLGISSSGKDNGRKIRIDWGQ